mmetsp:Transcript_118380/g.379506  ORF Transcript_118380/g.379506 Transcript_118380/m.379506 type:complete len:200 (-) Transcript_118380:130-729(-)
MARRRQTVGTSRSQCCASARPSGSSRAGSTSPGTRRPTTSWWKAPRTKMPRTPTGLTSDGVARRESWAWMPRSWWTPSTPEVAAVSTAAGWCESTSRRPTAACRPSTSETRTSSTAACQVPGTCQPPSSMSACRPWPVSSRPRARCWCCTPTRPRCNAARRARGSCCRTWRCGCSAEASRPSRICTAVPPPCSEGGGGS